MEYPQRKMLQLTRKAKEFMYALPHNEPDFSAIRVLSRMQKILLPAALAVLCLALITDWMATLIAINGLFLAFYLIIVVFKAYLIHASITSQSLVGFTGDEIREAMEGDLPPYTILVPLYREAEVLGQLLEGLDELVYPRDKLDVILLLEEDDAETLEAVDSVDLPAHIRALVVPDLQPRTKPKACNAGLAMAKGKYLVIYDAEDRPEPDQLLKAVLGFRRVPREVVCLQAKLNFYNQRHNLLTRLFTTDYSMWFDLTLPGLDTLEAPIPLGGTSNHFKVEKLKELLGWDPYNVTEDCDLGMRLAMAGYRTRMLDSTTWEEACSAVGFWIKQRSRWVKGYIQTYLVHLRRPVQHLKTLGLARTLMFHLVVAGTIVCLLINPVYWFLTAAWFGLRLEMISIAFPFPLVLWGALCLFVGNFLFIYAAMLATYQRGYYDIVKHCLLLPAYWGLASIGAWKGFLQIITRPSYWEKTMHGLDSVPGAGSVLPAGDREAPSELPRAEH